MDESLKMKVKELLREVEPEKRKEKVNPNINISGTRNIQAAGNVSIKFSPDSAPVKLSGPNIVHCPDCGNDVSIRAKTCIRCGCPVKNHFQMIGTKRLLKYLGVIFLVFVVLALFLPKPYNTCVALIACCAFFFILRTFGELNS